MSKSSRFSRLSVLAPAALSACIDASVLAAPAAGAILSTVMKELSKAFMLKNWFHGVMSAQEAEQLLLQKGRNGSYLVRESRTHPGDYVLSVRVRARVSHVMIRKEHNRYDVGSGEIFEDLTGLIEHCRAYPLTESSGEVLRLRQPVSGARPRPDPDNISTKLRLEIFASETVEQSLTMYSNIDQDLEMMEIADKKPEIMSHPETNDKKDKKTEDYSQEYFNVIKYDSLNTFTTVEGFKLENRAKNRYRDITPYDQTRVPLPRSPLGEHHTDYINANYIQPPWIFEKIAPALANTTGPMTEFSKYWRDGVKPFNRGVNIGASTSSRPDYPMSSPATSMRFTILEEEDNAMAVEDDFSTIPCDTRADEARRKQLIELGVVVDKVYIATQGCLISTRHSFWSMIADNDVRVIAMVTNTKEGDKTMCDEYWPPFGETEMLRNLQITNTCEQVHPFYTRRELQLVTLEKNVTVFQYHFTTWPDQMVPANTVAIRGYIRDMNERMRKVAQEADAPSKNIMCVHCSAGVGRTGTLIAIDMMFDITTIKGIPDARSLKTDIPNVVKNLRRQRPRMVQGSEQYKFIYDTMNDHIKEVTYNNGGPGPSSH